MWIKNNIKMRKFVYLKQAVGNINRRKNREESGIGEKEKGRENRIELSWSSVFLIAGS